MAKVLVNPRFSSVPSGRVFERRAEAFLSWVRFSLCIAFLLAFYIFPANSLAYDAPGTWVTLNGRFVALEPGYANLSIVECNVPEPPSLPTNCRTNVTDLKVDNFALRTEFSIFKVGDYIRLDTKEDSGVHVVEGVRGPWVHKVRPAPRLLILALCALALLALASFVTGGKPQKLILGMDGRYSNSKFQIALWFWVLISTYVAIVVFRVWFIGWDFLGGVGIPQNLLVLSGLSAFTYGGAKAITTAKVAAAMHPVPEFAGAVPPVANLNPKNVYPTGKSFIRNLTQNDYGGFDFGDFQMLVVTLLAVIMYSLLIFQFLGSVEFKTTVILPDVDTTVLAAFGIGQGAYLAKKAGGNVGTS